MRTPILLIGGQLDRCTPPTQAILFHRAVQETGGRSQLAVYPSEAHGIRSAPAIFDYAARLTAWFQAHIPEVSASGPGQALRSSPREPAVSPR